MSSDTTDPRVWDDDYMDYDDAERDYGYLSHLDDNAFVALTEHMDDRTMYALCRSSAGMRHRCKTLVPERLVKWTSVESVFVYAMQRITMALRPHEEPWFVVSYGAPARRQVWYGEKGTIAEPAYFLVDNQVLIEHLEFVLFPPCDSVREALVRFDDATNAIVESGKVEREAANQRNNASFYDVSVLIGEHEEGVSIASMIGLIEDTRELVRGLRRSFSKLVDSLVACIEFQTEHNPTPHMTSAVGAVPESARLFDPAAPLSQISDTEPPWYRRSSQRSQMDPFLSEMQSQRPWMFSSRN